MLAQTPEQCDELLGQCLGEGNLDACLTLYEPQASVLLHDARLRFIKSETGVEVSLSEALPQKLVALFGSLCQHRNPSTGIIRAVSNHNPRTGLTVTPAGAHIYESHALPRRPGRYRHVNPPTVRALRVYPSVRSCCPSCP